MAIYQLHLKIQKHNILSQTRAKAPIKKRNQNFKNQIKQFKNLQKTIVTNQKISI